MNSHYYQMPLSFGSIIAGKPLKKCSLGESISQTLFLLICTRKGDMPGEPDFGCDIWELQFERIVDQRKWEDAVERSLLMGIARYEKRIQTTKISIALKEVEVVYPFRDYPEVKHQASIRIDALLRHSEEPYCFSTDIYVSPLAG